MQETRSQILKLIKLQYSMTVNELAEALSISFNGGEATSRDTGKRRFG